MSSPYVGEIRMFGGTFAPVGWAFCDGSLLYISEYDTLFNLIGTTYGGDGQTTFGLPDLRGRIPIHRSALHSPGELSGQETVTLLTTQVTIHTHGVVAASGLASARSARGTVPAVRRREPGYAVPPGTAVTFGAQSVGASGGSQPHDNMQPFLCVSFIISLFGVYPSSN